MQNSTKWGRKLLPAKLHGYLLCVDDSRLLATEIPQEACVEPAGAEGTALTTRNQLEDYGLLVEQLSSKYELLETYLSWRTLVVIYKHLAISKLLEFEWLQLKALTFKVKKPP